MEKTTGTDTAASAPSASEAARVKTEREATRESDAQDHDEKNRRVAALTKAKGRVDEIVEYLDRIDGVIVSVLSDTISSNPLGQALDTFTLIEGSVEALEKKIKTIAGRMDYAREVSFPARLDADESKTFTSAETGNRITRTARIFASIVSDQTGETLKRAFAWLRGNGAEGLIKETVNSSSLSGLAKELMENGKEMPEDLFRVHTKDSVSITKPRK